MNRVQEAVERAHQHDQTCAPLVEAIRELDHLPMHVPGHKQGRGLDAQTLPGPYPPGIPIGTCGERIARPIIEYLRAAVDAGALLADTTDGRLETIRVVAEPSRR